MARPVAGDPLKDSTPILSPSARPTDTFVRPGKPVLGKGEALAKALGSLDRAVNPILKEEEKEAKEEEFAEGQQLWQKNRQDFKEAVREGTIPAGASPYVRKGYRQSQLHTLGANYATQLARSLEENELYKVDDPAQIEQHLKDFHEQFAETNNLSQFDETEVAEAFTPLVQQAHDGFRQKQAERNVQYVKEQRFLAAQQEIFATLDMQDFDGSSSQVNASINETAQWIKAKADELDSEGLDRTEISKSIIKAVATAAERRADPDILEVLKQVKLGTGPLSNTQFGRETIATVEDRIASEQLRNARMARIQEERAREQAIEELSLQATRAATRGDDDTFSQAVQQLGRLDASELRSVIRFKRGEDEYRLEHKQAGTWAHLDQELSNAESREEARRILSEYGASGLIDMGDQKRFMDDWEARQNSKFAELLNFDPVENMVGNIKGTIVGNEFQTNAVLKDKAARFQQTFQRLALDWYTKNRDDDGNVDTTEFWKWADQTLTNLRSSFVDEETLEQNAPIYQQDLSRGTGNTEDIPD